jgi:hypothetical protein
VGSKYLRIIKFTLKFTEQQYELLTQICHLRKMCVNGSVDPSKYANELIDADFAEFRLQRIAPDFLQARGAGAAPREDKIEVRGRQQLTAARIQKVLHLRDTYVSPSAIAQRLSISLVSVHRILRENDESKISVPTPGRASCRAVHDARPEASLVGFFPRIESRKARKSA